MERSEDGIGVRTYGFRVLIWGETVVKWTNQKRSKAVTRPLPRVGPWGGGEVGPESRGCCLGLGELSRPWVSHPGPRGVGFGPPKDPSPRRGPSDCHTGPPNPHGPFVPGWSILLCAHAKRKGVTPRTTQSSVRPPDPPSRSPCPRTRPATDRRRRGTGGRSASD